MPPCERQRRERAEDNFAHRGIQRSFVKCQGTRQERGQVVCARRPDDTSHKVINDVQRFIKANRPAREGEQLTSHGLRYNYAQSRMSELVSKGMPQEKAEAKVARELGHNRRRVTKGYLK